MERHHLENLGIDGLIKFKWIFKKWDGRGGGGSVGWIDLAQDRDRWQAFKNAVMNFRIP
jgi:hypothetical protein